MNRRFEHFPPGSEAFIDHPSQARPGIHTYPNRLYVLTMLENPLRARSRYQNYSNFERMVEESGAILYTAEVALGGRAFEITEASNPAHLQLRTQCEFWHKENALNLLAARLPSNCQYIAVFDADIEFARRDWAQEILHLLQHYDVIQPFSHAQNLGPDDTPSLAAPPTSFLHQWTHSGISPHEEAFTDERPVRWTTKGVKKNGPAVPDIDAPPAPAAPVPVHSHSGGAGIMGTTGAGAEAWHPGLAWAYRKSAWDKLGGLMDWLPTGSGDWHMANALIGQLTECLDPRHTASYLRNCRLWQERAIEVRDNPNGGLGCMPGLLLHRFHGLHRNRQYEHRHKFVINVEFDPDVDLKRDWQGLWQLTGRSPKLRDGLRDYARMRDEDSR